MGENDRELRTGKTDEQNGTLRSAHVRWGEYVTVQTKTKSNESTHFFDNFLYHYMRMFQTRNRFIHFY